MNRSGHYLQSEKLVDQAVQAVIAARARAGNDVVGLNLSEADFFLRAAKLHFELALIPAQVEREAAEQAKHQPTCTHGHPKGDCPATDDERPGHACDFGPRPGPRTRYLQPVHEERP